MLHLVIRCSEPMALIRFGITIFSDGINSIPTTFTEPTALTCKSRRDDSFCSPPIYRWVGIKTMCQSSVGTAHYSRYNRFLKSVRSEFGAPFDCFALRERLICEHSPPEPWDEPVESRYMSVLRLRRTGRRQKAATGIVENKHKSSIGL